MAPDGRSVVLIVGQRGRGSLQVGAVLADGTLGPLKPLLERVPEPNVGDARISPDGRLLAYTTNDPGLVEVFLTRFPDGRGQWQVGSEGGFQPRWTKGGRELIFVSGSGPTRRSLVAVRVDPTQDPPPGTITRLFDSTGDNDVRDFDVAPDQSPNDSRRSSSQEAMMPRACGS